ncbi:MAG TPA: YggS family pyridoxal phosphate-dependent enzyme [Chitinivibrionales bacterium]|nr:YggS family pyridoxal phosphate-dependent enzyme [Chitinivibrionales bacterium]
MDTSLFLSRYKSLQDRIAAACARSNRSPSDVRVIVVTKTHPIETIQTVIDRGIHDIGENRVQEIEQKMPQLKGAFEMHLVGHLQSNKVNKAVPLVQWIQSIDSIRLAEKAGACAEGLQKRIKALVQVKTSEEETKSGCAPGECFAVAESVAKNPGLEFCGLMTIGPLGASESNTRKSFAALRACAEQCRHLASRVELSMGMSADFEWAIEEGATMIRIGTLLLGERK